MMNNNMDNLKDAWKKITERGNQKEYSSAELQKIVRKKSNNELMKIRRKFILEWASAIVLSLFIIVFIQIVNKSDTLFALIFVGVILIISFFPYINIVRVKSENNTDLKSHLSRQARLQVQEQRHTFFSISIAMPTLFTQHRRKLIVNIHMIKIII